MPDAQSHRPEEARNRFRLDKWQVPEPRILLPQRRKGLELRSQSCKHFCTLYCELLSFFNIDSDQAAVHSWDKGSTCGPSWLSVSSTMPRVSVDIPTVDWMSLADYDKCRRDFSFSLYILRLLSLLITPDTIWEILRWASGCTSMGRLPSFLTGLSRMAMWKCRCWTSGKFGRRAKLCASKDLRAHARLSIVCSRGSSIQPRLRQECPRHDLLQCHDARSFGILGCCIDVC